MEKIESFSGEYRWLSNFWYCTIEYEGILYPSTEHAYQAAKTLDQVERQKMASMGTARESKKYGSNLEIRPDWNEVKVSVMLDVVRKKFENLALRIKLLETGNAELIEGNTWNDTFWGVCNGVGENNLGKVLMQVREEYSK